jgi:hypothetical protein
MKVYLIAGEPSGDLLGSRFMKAMRQKLGDGVEFYVNNQWSRDVFSDNILPLAKKIGFEINL